MRLSETPARVLAAVLLAATLVAAAGLARGRLAPFDQPPPAVPSLADSMAEVAVVDNRPDVPGYSRKRFGAGWAGHAGACTTRQAAMAAQLDGVTAGPDCRILTGTGVDPYTGEKLEATKAVEIDHVVPLAAAWDLGAADWDDAAREAFANDALNLVATSKAANRDKLDQLPAEWMPPLAPAHCWYARRLAAVAAAWNLALPRADAAAMRRACRFDSLRRNGRGESAVAGSKVADVTATLAADFPFRTPPVPRRCRRRRA